MTEITDLGAVKAPFTLHWGPRRPILIFMLPASSFFVKMWPSNELEFETPGSGLAGTLRYYVISSNAYVCVLIKKIG